MIRTVMLTSVKSQLLLNKRYHYLLLFSILQSVTFKAQILQIMLKCIQFSYVLIVLKCRLWAGFNRFLCQCKRDGMFLSYPAKCENPDCCRGGRVAHRLALQRLRKDTFLAGPRAKYVTSVLSRGFVVLRRNYKRSCFFHPICASAEEAKFG